MIVLLPKSYSLNLKLAIYATLKYSYILKPYYTRIIFEFQELLLVRLRAFLKKYFDVLLSAPKY